ncbi:MAG: type II CRISPR RNA-guided endonuclease Cas9 [Parvibaculum sp.]
MADDSRRYRPYRLGLDVGSNSLGWFVVWLNDKDEAIGLGPGGVRIYPDGRDPKSKESNAADRRMARGARRRRDRYLKRRSNLMSLLVRHGLMPEDIAARKALEALDPYELRAKALDETLPAHHIGRALFHLNQRRGFLSNRKTEKGDNESGAIKEAASRLKEAMDVSGARTLGEFFHRRHIVREPVRARNRSTGAKAEYDFYPTRQLLLDEFDAIWGRQAPHHASMTNEVRAEIHSEIFFQRPLKQPPVGKCSLDSAKDKDDAEGFRCPWAHPLAQRFRIWQEVRNLAVTETGQKSRSLAKEEGDRIALALLQNNKLSFDKIRSLLKLPAEARFNLESEKRKELAGDETAAKLSHKSLFGKPWRGLAVERQTEIVKRLLDEPDEEMLVAWLITEAGLDEETARRAASAFLPDSHCRLGLRAIRKILPHMEDGMNYPDAARAAGYDHALLPDGEVSLNGRLPYYGEWLQNDVLGSGDERDLNDRRWGRFPNPTVHIGLGQLRRVVNTLVKEIGPPKEIAVEMTRDFKLSPKKLAEVEKEQTENQRKNERRDEEIRKLRQAVNPRNRMKMRLWEEQNLYDPLDRRCPYTGEVISIERLLSDEVDIDHLIPFSMSWDDSAANKVVCMRYANRAKGNRTPFDAFGNSPSINGHRYDWEQISKLGNSLPKSKRWRFAPDALRRFDEMGGFQARQLNETGWLARVARHYLTAITDPYKIHVLPGKLTAMIRGKWGLNSLLPDHNIGDGKNRKDHRHHAIDAMVAALTDRSLLHRMSSAYDEERQKIDIPLPWESLRDDLDTRLKAMTVAHKPDHGVGGQLHEDTAYGSIKHPEKEGGANLVYRKDFLTLNEKEIGRIRDIRLRELVQAHVETEKADGKDLKSALQSFSARTDVPGLPNGVRHVRLTKTEKPNYLVSISTGNGATYKAYSAGENAFVDIYETSDGRWGGEARSLFQANQDGYTPRWRNEHPDARFIMRVFKGDLIALDLAGVRTVMVVHRLDAAANRFKLAAHNETGNLDQRHMDEIDPFRWLMASYNTLKTMNAERVRADELGRLWRVAPEEAARALGYGT